MKTMSSGVMSKVSEDLIEAEADLDDEMAEDGAEDEDDFWLGKLGDFLSPCRPVFRTESTESPTPPLSSEPPPQPVATKSRPVPVVEEEDPVGGVDQAPQVATKGCGGRKRAKRGVTVTINPRAGATKRKAAKAASAAVSATVKQGSAKADQDFEEIITDEIPEPTLDWEQEPEPEPESDLHNLQEPEPEPDSDLHNLQEPDSDLHNLQEPDPDLNNLQEPEMEPEIHPEMEPELDQEIEPGQEEEFDPMEEKALPLDLDNLVAPEVLHSSFIKTPQELQERIKLILEKSQETKKSKKKRGKMGAFDHARKCPLCGDETDTLNRHIKEAHGVDGVVCPHCSKILAKNCTLSRHIEQVHFNLQIHKPAKCDQCDKVFSKKGHLDRHVKTIHLGMKEESQPCPHCGKIFSTKSSLEPHIMMVHQGMRKKCPECGKVLSDLWKHMRTMHGQYRRRAKISKEEALENNLVPKDTKDRVNVKDIAAAKSVPTFTAEVDNPNSIEMVQVDLIKKEGEQHKYLDKVSEDEYRTYLENDGEGNLPDEFSPDTHTGNFQTQSDTENSKPNKRGKRQKKK